MKPKPASVSASIELRLKAGTMEAARQAAVDGATVEEVKAIIKAGLVTAAFTRPTNVFNYVDILPYHPLAGAL